MYRKMNVSKISQQSRKSSCIPGLIVYNLFVVRQYRQSQTNLKVYIMSNPVQMTTYLCQASNIMNSKNGSNMHGADYVNTSYMECLSLLAVVSQQFPEYSKIITLDFIQSMFCDKRDLQTIAECILKGSTIV